MKFLSFLEAPTVISQFDIGGTHNLVELPVDNDYPIQTGGITIDSSKGWVMIRLRFTEIIHQRIDYAYENKEFADWISAKLKKGG